MKPNHLKTIKNLYLSLPQKHKMIISSLSAVLLLLIIFPSEQVSASRQTELRPLEVGKRYPLTLPTENKTSVVNTNNIQTVKEEKTKNNIQWQSVKVKRGDSLAKILNRHHFNAQTTYNISHAKGKHTKYLTQIMVGDILRLGTNNEGKLVSLEYPLSITKTLWVNWANNHYQSHIETKSVETRIAYAQGKITSNFWNAGVAAGMSDTQIINLANVFGWDIDFALDLRKGDTFNIVYENEYIDGEFVKQGKILAAEFINQGDVFQAIRFTDGHYYTPEGKSMRKAFLRAPVNFRYISSNFKKRRFHPIQKRWKAHNGTDYRANTGTPVVAAGDGRVIAATYNRFNGNYVFIQHGNGIITKYLHFSKRAVKKGQRVKQGQVIGYVGMTGLAEAPHLHYEFLVNGVHRNPRTVTLPDAKPIANKYRTQFKQIAKQRLQELAGAKNTLLAMQASNKTSGKL